jgi:hypothetical protein
MRIERLGCALLLVAWGCGSGLEPAPGGDDDGGDDVGDAGDDDETPAPDPNADEDRDGFPAADDCDDGDAEVHPGADEVAANGQDDDCDGEADELRVCVDGGDHATIQAAIDAHPDGGLVEICPGTYAEHLAIDRLVRLRGEGGAAATIVDGGGAGLVVRVADAGEVALEGLTIRGGGAGGVACAGSTLALVDAVVADNVAVAGAGLRAIDCGLAIDGSRVERNVASGAGGGVYLEASRGEIAGSVLADNRAHRGGGVFQESGDVGLRGNEFLRNTAAVEGGGAGVYHRSRAPIRDNTVADNDSGYRGGGILVEDHGAPIEGNTVERNHSGDDGAGVYVIFYDDTEDQTIAIRDNVVRDNRSDGDAGGLRILGARATITGNLVVGNRAWGDGGGMKISHDKSLIEDNRFEANVSSNYGGGIELDDDSSTVVRCVVVGNRAARGGGIHANATRARFQIRATLIAGNTATQRGGGVGYDDVSARTSWSFVAIVDNTAPDTGGAYFEYGTVDLEDSIVAGNSGAQVNFDPVPPPMPGDPPPGPDDPIYTDGRPGEWAYVDVYPAVVDGMGDPRDIADVRSVEPGFVGGGDYHLAADSPLRDAGDPALRDPDGTRADLGAYAGPDAMP